MEDNLKNEDSSKNKNNPKIEDDQKIIDNLNSKNDLKNKGDLKNEDDHKNADKVILITVPWPLNEKPHTSQETWNFGLVWQYSVNMVQI